MTSRRLQRAHVSVDATNHIDLYNVDKHVEPAFGRIVTWYDRHLTNKVRGERIAEQA
jgi:hypothetical protein